MTQTMSTTTSTEDQQLSLHDFDTESTDTGQADDTGQANDTETSNDEKLDDWTPTTTSTTGTTCGNCGSSISPAYTRVFGDADGEIDACPNCSTRRERAHGATIANR